MKKTLMSIVAVAFVALMIANAYGNGTCLPTIPTPPCCCGPPGLTPGFWKHDITVRIAHLEGLPKAPSYNAFPDGTKLTDGMMDNYLDAINNANPGLNLDFYTALAILQLPGWSTDRTNLANWFNYEAGYGWY